MAKKDKIISVMVCDICGLDPEECENADLRECDICGLLICPQCRLDLATKVWLIPSQYEKLYENRHDHFEQIEKSICKNHFPSDTWKTLWKECLLR